MRLSMLMITGRLICRCSATSAWVRPRRRRSVASPAPASSAECGAQDQPRSRCAKQRDRLPMVPPPRMILRSVGVEMSLCRARVVRVRSRRCICAVKMGVRGKENRRKENMTNGENIRDTRKRWAQQRLARNSVGSQEASGAFIKFNASVRQRRLQLAGNVDQGRQPGRPVVALNDLSPATDRGMDRPTGRYITQEAPAPVCDI